MKSRHLFSAFLLAILAVIFGWKFDHQDVLFPEPKELLIPDDIDYYLTELDYRVTNQDGQLDYKLQSPYLAHYRRADLSRITSPDIQLFRDQQPWQITANKAELEHQLQRLSLLENVVMNRAGDNAMHLTSEQLLFEPDINRLTSPGPIQIQSFDHNIDAASAEFDLKKNIYRLQTIKAIYHVNQS